MTARLRLAAFACLLLAIALPAAAQKKEPAKNGKEAEKPAAPEQVQLEQNEELSLAVGENRTLSAMDVKSFAEGVKGIADVRLTPDSSQFVIVGQKPGSTTLLLLKNDRTQVNYQINVSPRPMQSVERELLQLLEGTTGVRVRRVGARLFIEGGVSTEPELKRIAQIASLFPGQVESLVVLGGAAAESKLNIRVDFLFVQFDRTKGYQAGVSWPGKFGGLKLSKFSGELDLLAGAATSAQASVIDQPLPGLDLAATKGWAKVLKHSTVIASNGTEATFSSGGEQNYLVTTGFAATLTQIRFGTNVKVLPRFDSTSKELRVQLEAEVMDLTPPVATGADLPGRNVSKLNTAVALRLGQSIVLSGIRSRSQRHSVGGLPLLSEIPLLGLLFGSHGDAQEEVEGAIFVVPSVIESIPKGAQEVLDGALQDYQEFSGDMNDVNAWEKNPATAPGVRTQP
ncbi:MAG: Type secretion system secretin RcpA/CpaC, associated with Flp pilus assembly [Polyangiaceae bacterium]|jgi:pilus assembly protein CpaC|nr:Type secretion system secretin RcpA/CpaC, associated with Flp pilus assembly [Polyangiaceae bacterium]